MEQERLLFVPNVWAPGGLRNGKGLWAKTNGNVAEAARRLGINRTRIYRKLGEKTMADQESGA